jgi:hypothetical protein
MTRTARRRIRKLRNRAKRRTGKKGALGRIVTHERRGAIHLGDAEAPSVTRCAPAPEHPLQKQIADALRLEIAPPGKVSRDGVVWWSVDHASYAGTAPGARIGRGIIAGVPDLFVLFRGIAHMVEIKAQDARCLMHSARSPLQCSRPAGTSVSCAMPRKCWRALRRSAVDHPLPDRPSTRPPNRQHSDLANRVLHRGVAHMIEVKAPAGELSDPQQSVMTAVAGGRWPGGCGA